MASIAAKNVAKQVLETVRKGKRPNLGDIIEKNGYAKTTSTVPSQVTNTKSYQEVIYPVVVQLEKERQRIINTITKKNIDEERYRDLVEAIDKLTKNIQLLSGKETERQGVTINLIDSFTNENGDNDTTQV